LQQKHSTVYLIDNDKKKILKVYVFSSEEERKQARVEYNEKTAHTLMVYHEIHQSKNVMVILTAGDKTNHYYLKVSSAIEKIYRY
jgi:general stress protein 26